MPLRPAHQTRSRLTAEETANMNKYANNYNVLPVNTSNWVLPVGNKPEHVNVNAVFPGPSKKSRRSARKHRRMTRRRRAMHRKH